MTTQHTKSACCRAKTWHYGGRRRQCVKCLKTWRIYVKKTGRKRKLIDKNLLTRRLLEKQTLKQQHKQYYRQSCSLSGLRKRFRQSLKLINKQKVKYPDSSNNYILLVDSTWFKFKNKHWLVYLLILRPINSNIAMILDSTTLKGQESYEKWIRIIDEIPIPVKERIKAMISDNFHGSSKITRHYGWVHQLCNFHLLSELHRRRGKRDTTLSARPIRESIYQNVCGLLKTTNSERLKQITKNLIYLSSLEQCPKKIKMMVNSLIRKQNNYRAYLIHPELNLPNTNNTVESAVKMVKELTRTLKSPASVKLWINAFIKIKPYITCNGKSTKKSG